MTLEKAKIENVIPTDVNIFYEDGVPFLKYTGTTYIDGRKVEVSIPKMDLCLREINTHSEVKYEENNGITREIAKLNLDNLRPIDALNELYKIKDMINKEA